MTGRERKKLKREKRKGLGTYRIPTTGSGVSFKDKKKYDRKKKHPKGDDTNE